MKFLSYFIFITFILTTFKFNNDIIIDKEEAQKASETLQDIRGNPNKYFEELNFEEHQQVSAMQLQWNDALVKVAETKAYDMANRDYFGHTDPDGYGINHFIHEGGYKLNPDWTRKKDDNSFESIAVGVSSGEEGIKGLVKDSGSSSLGHRKHLLGLDTWNSNLTDIGIGFCRRDSGSRYKTYMCVITAKHDW